MFSIPYCILYYSTYYSTYDIYYTVYLHTILFVLYITTIHYTLLCHYIPYAYYYYTGLGEEQSMKLKLRLGLDLRTLRAYAKLRFRTEPISLFNIKDGLACGGKVSVCKYGCFVYSENIIIITTTTATVTGATTTIH